MCLQYRQHGVCKHVEGCSLFGGRVAGVTQSMVVFGLSATEDHAPPSGNVMMTVELKRRASTAQYLR